MRLVRACVQVIPYGFVQKVHAGLRFDNLIDFATEAIKPAFYRSDYPESVRNFVLIIRYFLWNI